jgi:phosphoribosylaminoimidazolecarboxamide formyltransferase/IMP cyclohydrolase
MSLRRFALFSCSDKSGIGSLARFFQDRKFDILSTGGTYSHLKEHNSVRNDKLFRVNDVTGFPEILDGRVKTLHPAIFGGLLGVRDNIAHSHQMRANQIARIDVLVSNLYPFQDTVRKYDTVIEGQIPEIIEQIDIGGVALTRAAAKNYKYVTAITNVKQYSDVIRRFDMFTERDRLELAIEAFRTTSVYDEEIYDWLYNTHRCRVITETRRSERLPNINITKRNLHSSRRANSVLEGAFEVGASASNLIFGNSEIVKRKYTPTFDLKYGSNPHQSQPGGSRVYSINNGRSPFKVINGTPSYINVLDAINSWQLVTDLSERFGGTQAAASFKHTSPAGAAVKLDSDVEKYPEEAKHDHFLIAYKKAREGDPMCSFGDFIAISGLVTETLARYIAPLVSDGIVARDFMPEAIEILKKKKKGNYVMIQAEKVSADELPDIEFREMYGIGISQPVNKETIEWDDFKLENIVSNRKTLTKYEKDNLMMANTCLKYAQSNNVALAVDGQLIGISAGQQSRIHSVRLAARKAEVWMLRNEPEVSQFFEHVTDRMPHQDAINLKTRLIEDFLGDELTYLEKKMYKSIYGIDDLFLLNLYAVIKSCTHNNDPPHGIALASDAFFPFRDNIDCASKVHVSAIAQPGGSIKDDDVTTACNEYNIAMIHHGKRMFTH